MSYVILIRHILFPPTGRFCLSLLFTILQFHLTRALPLGLLRHTQNFPGLRSAAMIVFRKPGLAAAAAQFARSFTGISRASEAKAGVMAPLARAFAAEPAPEVSEGSGRVQQVIPYLEFQHSGRISGALGGIWWGKRRIYRGVWVMKRILGGG